MQHRDTISSTTIATSGHTKDSSGPGRRIQLATSPRLGRLLQSKELDDGLYDDVTFCCVYDRLLQLMLKELDVLYVTFCCVYDGEAEGIVVTSDVTIENVLDGVREAIVLATTGILVLIKEVDFEYKMLV